MAALLPGPLSTPPGSPADRRSAEPTETGTATPALDPPRDTSPSAHTAAIPAHAPPSGPARAADSPPGLALAAELPPARAAAPPDPCLPSPRAPGFACVQNQRP